MILFHILKKMDYILTMNKEDITNLLLKALDNKRFLHTLGVADTAACLSMKYGYDMEKAYMAGLLHDCGKGMDDKEKIDYCHKNGIEINSSELDNPSLLHAKVGAHLAEFKYGVADKDIISAIRWHTTGRPNMDILEEIIFAADYIEPNRNHDKDLHIIRSECFENLQTGICHIYKNTLEFLKYSLKSVDPTTNEAYLFYKRYK